MPERRGRDAGDDQPERTIEDVLNEVERKMGQSIEAMRRDISTLRTGRATPALIEDLSVDYYGSPTPLKQIASISAPDARAIMVQPLGQASPSGTSSGALPNPKWGSTPPTTATSSPCPFPR